MSAHTCVYVCVCVYKHIKLDLLFMEKADQQVCSRFKKIMNNHSSSSNSRTLSFGNNREAGTVGVWRDDEKAARVLFF